MGIFLNAYAKLNLSLDIVGKYENGYHALASIMQTIDVHDKLVLEKSASGISLTCDDASLRCDESNLCWKAAKLFLERLGCSDGICIGLEKRIPMGAGMGGGSADAAAVLLGMNKLFGVPFSMDALVKMGAGLGADVPFCLLGGTMLAEGIGDELTPLPRFFDVHFVIIKPEVSIHTAQAYRAFDENRAKLAPVQTGRLLNALEKGEQDAFFADMRNVFEETAAEPAIGKAKAFLCENGAAASMMTGSGSAVFGVFKSASKAAECAEKAEKYYRTVFLSQPIYYT